MFPSYQFKLVAVGAMFGAQALLLSLSLLSSCPAAVPVDNDALEEEEEVVAKL